MAARCVAVPALLLLLSLAVPVAEAAEPASTTRAASSRVPIASRPQPLVTEPRPALVRSPPVRQRQGPSALSRADSSPPQTQLSPSPSSYVSPLDSPLYIPGAAAAPASDGDDRAEVERGLAQPQLDLRAAENTFYPALVRGGYSASGATSDLTTDTFLASGTMYITATYPTAAAAAATTRNTTFPVVVWAPGNRAQDPERRFPCKNIIENVATMAHLASWGFIVVCPELLPESYFGDHDDYLRVIQWANRMNEDQSGRFFGRVSQVGAAGYSIGGQRLLGAQVVAENAAVAVAATAANALRVRSRSRGATEQGSARVAAGARGLLGGEDVSPENVGSAILGAVVSLQGFLEGFGSTSRTPLLKLNAEDDLISGPWRETNFPSFERARGPKLMAVVNQGRHNLGPHYWLGAACASNNQLFPVPA